MITETNTPPKFRNKAPVRTPIKSIEDKFDEFRQKDVPLKETPRGYHSKVERTTGHGHNAK
jgi:hypothetical protein